MTVGKVLLSISSLMADCNPGENIARVHLTTYICIHDKRERVVNMDLHIISFVSVTGTLKHVKSSMARSGGIVLQWSGAGG